MGSDDKALYNQKGLDVKQALGYLGDINLYRTILYDYYEVIDEKCDKIKKYIDERNAKEYTVEVHAIKSTSRMIGAAELGDMAAKLEKYGDAADWDSILAETDKVLEVYKSYKDIVAPHMVKSDD